MWFYILFLFVLHLLSTQIHAVNMCTSGSAASTVSTLSPSLTSVTLNLVRGTGSSGCRCNVKLQNPDTIGYHKITFQAKNFSGCQYILVISYDNNLSLYSCTLNNYNIVYDINPEDEIKIVLNETSSQDDTEFEVKITSSVTAIGGPLLKLTCLEPNKIMSTTVKQQVTTPIQQVTTPIQQVTTPIQQVTTPIQQVTTPIQQVTTPMTTEVTETSSTLISSTIVLSDSTKVRETTAPLSSTKKPNASKQRDDTDIIIGGAVGGGLLLVIVVIIIVCIIRQGKKKKAKRNYDRPLVRASDPGYTDVVIAGQDGANNLSQEGVDNVVHSATDSMPTQQHAQEMVIIENDLYVSSDDVMNSTSRDDDSNQKPDTVYAVVQKDRKPKNTTSTNGDGSKSSNERKFVIGPQGDEYALVTRN